MQNLSPSPRKKRKAPKKTVVCRESGFSIRKHGAGYLVQVRRRGINEAKYFLDLDEARLHCRALAIKRVNEGLAGFALTPKQRDDAVKALKMLEGRASLCAAAQEWLRLNPPATALTVAQLFDRHVENLATRNRRAKTIQTRRQFLNRFATDYGTRAASSILPGDVEEWLKLRIPEKTFNTMRFCLGAAYSYGVRQRLVEINPVRAVEPKQFDHAEPHFWNAATVAAVMHKAAEADAKKAAQQAAMKIPEAVPWLPITPYLALSAFGGLRPQEVERLDWSNINLEDRLIRIPASASKVRRGRLVPMEDNLIEWLLPHRKDAGRIAPSPITIRRQRKSILKAAKLPARWPQDVLRHSFATHWMALHAHEGRLAEMLGNSPGIIQKHYKGLATKAEGEKYFQVRPRAGGTIIQLNRAAG